MQLCNSLKGRAVLSIRNLCNIPTKRGERMQAEWQRFWQEPRNRVLFFAFLLLAGYAVFIQVTSAPADPLSAIVAEQGHADASVAIEKQGEPKRVKGAEKAKKNIVLQDPFHIQHSTRQKSAEPPVRVESVVKQEQTKPVEGRNAVSVRKKTELHLTGVLQGVDRAMVLLVLDGKKASLAVGESIGGYKLESVERECACLMGPDGEIILRLGE